MAGATTRKPAAKKAEPAPEESVAEEKSAEEGAPTDAAVEIDVPDFRRADEEARTERLLAGEATAEDRRILLAQLRQPIPKNLIGKKPVGVDKTAPYAQDCEICHGRHKPAANHLDYAGHAAITDRLLAVDPTWDWRPVTDLDLLEHLPRGTGMWIELTVCGVTRLGYGDPGERNSGSNDGIKETIGDALRNAAMRFGLGLELWHKGDFYEQPEEREMRENEERRRQERQEQQRQENQRRNQERRQAQQTRQEPPPAATEHDLALQELTALCEAQGWSIPTVAGQMSTHFGLRMARDASVEQIREYIALLQRQIEEKAEAATDTDTKAGPEW